MEIRTLWNAAEDGATVSPDGKVVAFIDWSSGDVAVFDIAAGSTRRLTQKGGWDVNRSWAEPPLVFAPGGNRLVFPYANALEADPFRYELRWVELNDTSMYVLDVLAEDASQIAPLDWHPELGILYKTVAADEGSELRIVNPTSGTTRVLERREPGSGIPAQAFFTKDGRAVVTLVRGVLNWLPMEGGVSRGLELEAEALLGWIGSGTTLLFHATCGEVTGNWMIALREGQLAGEPILLSRTSVGVLPAGRTRDGVHYTEPVELPRLHVASVNLQDGRVRVGPQPITHAAEGAAGNPAWSRDGSRLAYTLKVPNRDEYRVMVADGSIGLPREIARVHLSPVTGLDWTADGSFLVIAGRGASRGTSWIGRINVVTGAIERLISQPTTAVATGPNEQIVYARAALAGEATVQVVLLPYLGADPRVVATFPVAEVPRSLSVSPDGEWVAVLKPVDERNASVLQLLPVRGGDPRTVVRLERPDVLEWNVGSIPWTADGEHVLLLVRTRGRVHFALVEVNSGRIIPLELAPAQGGRTYPALHPDRQRVVYVDGIERAAVRMMVTTGLD